VEELFGPDKINQREESHEEIDKRGGELMKTTFLRGACLAFVGWAALLSNAEAEVVNWTAINPAFAGATYVRDAEVCAGCHEDSMEPYSRTAHGRAFAHDPKGALAALNCEACHGPRSHHVDNPDASLALTERQYQLTCLQCHQDGGRMYWQSSPHKAADVSCTSCHTVMEKRSHRALLAKVDEKEVCYSCHVDVRGQMQKTFHHPVREGKMDCSSCHNVHGSVGRNLLIGATVNETCFACHQEKRGPFVWEHPVVRENCANCHDAHGSNNRDLLNTKGSFLCLQCHSYGGHINLPRYNRTSNSYGQGCVNCHVTQHGSNHPSGAKFTR
jgi:DmsE family decaheme c-type cytochrome